MGINKGGFRVIDKFLIQVQSFGNLDTTCADANSRAFGIILVGSLVVEVSESVAS